MMQHTQKRELAVRIWKVCSHSEMVLMPRRSPLLCRPSPGCAAGSVSGCCSAPLLGYYGPDRALKSQRPYPGGATHMHSIKITFFWIKSWMSVSRFAYFLFSTLLNMQATYLWCSCRLVIALISKIHQQFCCILVLKSLWILMKNLSKSMHWLVWKTPLFILFSKNQLWPYNLKTIWARIFIVFHYTI